MKKKPKFLFCYDNRLLKKIIIDDDFDGLNHSFLETLDYAFEDIIFEKNKNIHTLTYKTKYSDNDFPMMLIDKVDVVILSDSDLVNYIYVFENDGSFIHDKMDDDFLYNSYTVDRKLVKELVPVQILEIHYENYNDYYKAVITKVY